MSNPEVRTHHKFGMSKLNYLDACSGYESRPGTSAAAEDGTRLHDIMQTTAKLVAQDVRNKTFRAVSKNFQLDDEDRGLLNYCSDEVDRWLGKGFTDLKIETKVTIRRPVHTPLCIGGDKGPCNCPVQWTGTELNHGFIDLLMCKGIIGVLHDYKFGWEPVPDAEINKQGLGYSLAILQEFPALEKVGCIFTQPRLGRTTRKVYTRADMPAMYATVKRIIDDALAPAKRLNPGTQCDYCLHNGTCAALAATGVRALQVFEPMPMPLTFDGLKIETTEDLIKALYVRDRLRAFFAEANKTLDDRAKELLRVSPGQRLEHRLPDGQVVTVELKHRKAPRTAHSPLLIADALAPTLGQDTAMSVVLSACDPQITKLEDNFADKLVEASKNDPTAERMTKKHAKEILDATLRAEGLVTAADRPVEYLKVRVEKLLPSSINQPKQIESKSHDQINHEKT